MPVALMLQVAVTMGQKDWKYKVAAICSYLLCFHFTESHGQQKFWKEFSKEFERSAPGHNIAPSPLRKFAKKWTVSFMETGSIACLPRRRPKLCDEDARAIGVALGNPPPSTFQVTKTVGRGRYKHHITQSVQRKVHYTSLKQFLWSRGAMAMGCSLKTVHRRLRGIHFTRLRLVYKNLHPRKTLQKSHMPARKRFAA